MIEGYSRIDRLLVFFTFLKLFRYGPCSVDNNELEFVWDLLKTPKNEEPSPVRRVYARLPEHGVYHGLSTVGRRE